MDHSGIPRFNVLQVKGGADSRPPGTMDWKLYQCQMYTYVHMSVHMIYPLAGTVWVCKTNLMQKKDVEGDCET